jgi:arabinan endo-1,5-alpha-L-arabinosidase
MRKLIVMFMIPKIYLLLLLSFVFHQLPAQELQKNIPVHDPVMIKQDGTYYLFTTGRGISVWSSKDMQQWKREEPVFSAAPAWAVEAVPTFKNHIWAPDIALYKGRYYLFYSVSAFGKNTSAIGLASNKTLHPGSPDYKWEDHGKIVQSVPGRDLWNAIDPNLIVDEAGTPWMSFGSFWGGIKLVKLREDLKAVAEPQEWHTIASRPRDPKTDDRHAGAAAIEAPFIFRKGNYYYQFVSFDVCCKGVNSTYKMVVGRAEKVTGPYLDRNGEKMVHGGGTLVLAGNEQWHGVGHNAVATFDGTDYLIFHGYEAADNGKSKLRISKLTWDKEGWPVVGPAQ